MQLSVERETLLRPLQHVIGVVERRQTLPVLSNVLIEVRSGQLTITATDLEVELSARTDIQGGEDGAVTVPGRKLVDIVRNLSENAVIDLRENKDRVVLKSGRSRFTLATLAASEFPKSESMEADASFSLSQGELKKLLEATNFAMAVQDVRYYLNGLMLELGKNRIKTVATDGHRLAMADADVADFDGGDRQVIVPRKGIQELIRLLDTEDSDVTVGVGQNHVSIAMAEVSMVSKLIDGRFPDYDRVIPKGGDKIVSAERLVIRQALTRTSILSNEKYRGVRLKLTTGQLEVQAHNPEQEEAEEQLEVNYDGPDLEIGFNVNYLLDALAVMNGEVVDIQLIDSNSSALLKDAGDDKCLFVVMPMRL